MKQQKYDVGDIVEYIGQPYLVQEIKNAFSNVSVYVMVSMKTGYQHKWFTVDIDDNSKLVA